LYEAFARGDVAAFVAALDPGIVWNEAEGFMYADGNPYVGPDAIMKGVFARIAADLDNFVVTPARFVDGGDAVAVEGRYTGTMKATGLKVDTQFLHVRDVSGGKIVRFQQYTDTAQWARAAGQFV
jgi:uncharacterized protein